MIVETSFLTKGTIGLTIFPFIFIKQGVKQTMSPEEYAVLINHEKIHLRQQLELLILPFYLLYLGSYIYNLFIFGNGWSAYRFNIFETEAYAHESNLNYLHHRKWFAWIRK